ncbi:MAG: hypothetical protein Q8Q20_03935 [bacterium]|nr:hypothetical protein [bacterium]
MPDINLLNDTSGDEERKKQKKTPPPISYTDPKEEIKEDVTEPKLPKRVGPGLFGRFFKKKKDNEPVSESFRGTTPPPPTPPMSNMNRFSRLEEKKRKKGESLVLEEKVVKSKKKEKKKKVPEFGNDTQSFLDVNLMPADLIEGLDPKRRLFQYMIALIVSCLVVGGAYLGLSYYEQSIHQDSENLAKQINEVEKTIEDLRDEQRAALVLKSRIDHVTELLDKHVYWSNFFTLLEKYTLSEIQYENFSGSFVQGTAPSFSMNALGKDFQSIAKQIKAFEEATDFITQVNVLSGNQTAASETSPSAVNFPLQISVKEEIFYKVPESAEEE